MVFQSAVETELENHRRILPSRENYDRHLEGRQSNKECQSAKFHYAARVLSWPIDMLSEIFRGLLFLTRALLRLPQPLPLVERPIILLLPLK